ncbi:uncharacterized protein METZ01_LOCUS297569, partial [marine metagenome]
VELDIKKTLIAIVCLILFYGCAVKQKVIGVKKSIKKEILFFGHDAVLNPIDAKELIEKDGQMYKPKSLTDIFGQDELFMGMAISYFKSGGKESRGTYRYGKKDGNWIYWHEGFGKASAGAYLNGEKSGNWIYWHENTGIASAGAYLNDKKDGYWTYWYEVSGKNIVESEGTYKLGNRDGNWTYWYPNGEKKERGSFKHRERVGKWSYYNKDGSLDIVIQY